MLDITELKKAQYDLTQAKGIGLATTKKIIERHNGLITAHSNQDQGARFGFILPATH